jgi:hypothetical protein
MKAEFAAEEAAAAALSEETRERENRLRAMRDQMSRQRSAALGSNGRSR